MDYLLDSNAISDIAQGNHSIVRCFNRLDANDRAVTSVIVVGEVEFGLERMPRGKRQRETEENVRSVLDDLIVIPLMPEASSHYARLKYASELSGISLSDNDLWIAATIFAVGATLVTRDQDFSRIPGLLLEDWSNP